MAWAMHRKRQNDDAEHYNVLRDKVRREVVIRAAEMEHTRRKGQIAETPAAVLNRWLNRAGVVRKDRR